MVPVATMTKAGKLSTATYKAIGSDYTVVKKDKALKVVNLRSYSFSYIEIVAIDTPTWSAKIPTKIAISLHSDTSSVEGITWKRIHGILNIKVYKADNYIYLVNNDSYEIYCFITIRSSQINNKDYPLEILDSLPEGATEITEST